MLKRVKKFKHNPHTFTLEVQTIAVPKDTGPDDVKVLMEEYVGLLRKHSGLNVVRGPFAKFTPRLNDDKEVDLTLRALVVPAPKWRKQRGKSVTTKTN